MRARDWMAVTERPGDSRGEEKKITDASIIAKNIAVSFGFLRIFCRTRESLARIKFHPKVLS